jgi:hypothetical protein
MRHWAHLDRWDRSGSIVHWGSTGLQEVEKSTRPTYDLPLAWCNNGSWMNWRILCRQSSEFFTIRCGAFHRKRAISRWPRLRVCFIVSSRSPSNRQKDDQSIAYYVPEA